MRIFLKVLIEFSKTSIKEIFTMHMSHECSCQKTSLPAPNTVKTLSCPIKFLQDNGMNDGKSQLSYHKSQLMTADALFNFNHVLSTQL